MFAKAIVLNRLWDLSRTSEPSLLGLRASGHPLVSRQNSSGEEQVSLSALDFEQKKSSHLATPQLFTSAKKAQGFTGQP